MSPTTHTIGIPSSDRRFKVNPGTNLLTALQDAGFQLPSSCGGNGTCGECKVQIERGNLPPSETERANFSTKELKRGWRLACQQQVNTDLAIRLPERAEAHESKTLLALGMENVDLDPDIQQCLLDWPSPGRKDQRPDTQRLADACNAELEFPLSILRKIPLETRKSDRQLTLIKESSGRAIDLLAGDHTDAFYGIAFDIGTTTVAGYLLNLSGGKQTDVRSLPNPQQRYGADVISRIKHARECEGGLRDLQTAIVDALNKMIEGFPIPAEKIFKISVVGNPTILHLLAGIDPTNIDQSPYIPVLKSTVSTRANNLDLNIPDQAPVHLLPALSGFVGSDSLAGALATGVHRSERVQLLIDFGTNGEIILADSKRILAASAAAGPAFEAANVKQGMVARKGAISHVQMSRSEVEVEIIGDQETPQGFCGSGLVDAVGELLKQGLVAAEGNFVRENSHPLSRRLIEYQGSTAFILEDSTPPILVTQSDVRELQLAKAAIRAGVETLMDEMNVSHDDIDDVYLAGAFGNDLRKENVLRLGVVPVLSPEKISSVGNAAGQGCKLSLASKQKHAELEEIARKARHLELSFQSDFSERFTKAMRFPSSS